MKTIRVGSRESRLAVVQYELVMDAIRAAHPQALECALRLARLVELRLGSPLTDDEVSYLTLHVARVAQELR